MEVFKKKRPHADAGRLFRGGYDPTLLQEPREPRALPEQVPEQVQVREPEQRSEPASALPPSCSQQLQTITS
jgi:hypothetical protein